MWEALKQGYSSKKEIYVLLNPEYNNEEKLSDLLNNWSRALEANGIAFKLFAFYKNDR